MNISASAKASDIISRINGVQSYDIDAIRDKLTQKYTNDIGNLNTDDRVKSLIMKNVVHGQADEYAKQDALIIQKLNNEYESLVSTNSDKANDYLNWSDADKYMDAATGGLKYDNVSLVLNREEVLNTLGNQRIASGDFVGAKISDLSLDDLRNVIGAKGNGNAYNQTQTRVNAYLSAVDALDAESGGNKQINAMLNIIHSRNTNYSNFATSSIDDAVDLDSVVTQMNDAIKKAGKVLNGPVEDIVKNTSMWNNKSVKIATGIALGLAAAGFIASQFTSPPSVLNPSKRPNGTGSPNPDGDYSSSSKPMITAAPPSENTVRMASGNGVNFRVKGVMNPNLSNRDIAEAVGRTARKQGNLNVNVNSRDQSNIDRSWLQQQVSNMI
jgi:hypothetical protein